MQVASEKIVEFCRPLLSENDFSHDEKTIDACLRNFQVLGDAAKLVPLPIRNELAELPWKKITGMRNVLVHEYFGVSHNILWNAVKKDIPGVLAKLKEINIRLEKPRHPWRICPPGEVYVRPATVKTHTRKGHVVREHLRRDYCRESESTSKDVLTTVEMHDISEIFFSTNEVLPQKIKWEFGIKGDQFDELIGGWVRYWNEAFSSATPLDPNIVKALIASESSFDKNAGKGKRGRAKGLMQLMPVTIKYLRGSAHEINDNLLHIDADEILDPNVNIGAGVRWLFRKKETAAARLGRPATWEEAVAEYKDYLWRRLKNPKANQKGIEDFERYLKQLSTEKQ